MQWLSHFVKRLVALGQAAMDRLQRLLCSLTNQDRRGLADPCNNPLECPVGFCYESNGCAGPKLAGGAPMTMKACWLLAQPNVPRSWSEVVWPKTTPDFVAVGARCVGLYYEEP